MGEFRDREGRPVGGTVYVHEIDGHGRYVELSTSDGRFLGTFDRAEVFTFAAWEAAGEAAGHDVEYVPPSVVLGES